MPQSRFGYTLPVFACASAVAALRYLHQEYFGDTVSLDLIEPPQIVEIPIEQVACIKKNIALAITRSDPGDNLDLTRHTPVWAIVEMIEKADGRGIHGLPCDGRLSPSRWQMAEGKERERGRGGEQIIIQGGEGIGKQLDRDGKAAIYSYAQKLLRENLQKYLQPHEKIIVTIILPEGRRLAERTSNEAFGVVEGLSLLGTTGISQPLSAPSQLEAFQGELVDKAQQFDALVFCVGENGLDLAQKMGINSKRLIKTANWLGSMLVAAGMEQVRSLLLFGYHGKLIKLAGNIFHTHHHLADGRLEILTAHCANLGLPTPILQQIFTSPTTEAALKLLRKLDSQENSHWVEQVYGCIAQTIDRNSQNYIRTHTEHEVQVGTILFDRNRQILVCSQTGKTLLEQLIKK